MDVNERAAFLAAHKTLVDAVCFNASLKPEFVIYNELSSKGEVKEYLTYRELLVRARALAALACQCTQPGDRALILLPIGVNFVIAFLACALAGLVAVPSYPFRVSAKADGSNRNTDRIVSIVEDATPCLVFCDKVMMERKFELSRISLLFEQMQWMVVADVMMSGPVAFDRRDVNEIAFLQYTSGSTGTPKGVMVSQENLISAFADMDGSNQHDEASVMVTWVPAYHDMGLIYGLLTPLYFGFVIYSLVPAVVLQQPICWLQAISKFRGTHSAAPNFAYELCVKKITLDMKSELDLSSWRSSSNGAEPVRPTTLMKFYDAFKCCGLADNTVLPGYGLAEATLKVTSTRQGRPAKQLWVDADAYEQGGVVICEEALEGKNHSCLQSCGQSDIGADIRIVNAVTLDECRSNEVGEIWVNSTSVAMGYWNRPEITNQVFDACLRNGGGPYLRTGDLGFVFDSELYISGRIKDVIIRNGRNIYPQDLEQTAEQSHLALRAGRCCAFGIETPAGEQIVVVAEIERAERYHVQSDAVVRDIQEAIARVHELSLMDIVLMRSGTLPLTSSGKVQRALTRAEYCSGKLAIVFSLLRSAKTASVHNLVDEEAALVRSYIYDYLSGSKKLVVEGIDADRSFNSIGLDSIEILELTDWLAKKLKRELPADLLVDFTTINLLSHYLAESAS